MTNTQKHDITVTLEYTAGEDEPEQGIYRRAPLPPGHSHQLAVAIRDHPELASEDADVYPENPSQLQVHLIGSSAALEELGRYLIALARLDTRNPEPYESLDDVRNIDGGTIRLIPRRVSDPPARTERNESYSSGFRR